MSTSYELMNKVEQFNEQKTALAVMLREQFKDLFTDFFQNWKCITHVGWIQYTPYFNDGDACVFSRHDMGFKTIWHQDDDEDNEDGWISDPKIWRNRVAWDETDGCEENLSTLDLQSLESDLIELSDNLNRIDDQIYLDIFGDSAKVIVSREKIEIEEYDHD